jgi:predicted acetyltransferase
MASLPTIQIFSPVTDLDVVTLTKQEAGRLNPMMADYLAYMSEFTEVSQDKDGQLIYPYLAHYWREPDRFAFILEADGQDCGFALVRKVLDPDTGHTYSSMAEFYIAPGHRHLGLGRAAAKIVMQRFPGPWEVSVLKNNLLARSFWPNVLDELCVKEIEPKLLCTDVGTHFRYDLTV